LDGIENADSVSISGHKWFFQPKESGLILFKDVSKANQTISASSGYLTTNNVGILGSHGAIALPLMATLIAWGKTGLIERLERSMNLSIQLWEKLNENSEITVFNKPTTGVVLWRLNTHNQTKELFSLLPTGSASFIEYKNQFWIRNVAANPSVDVDVLWKNIHQALIKLKK
jgi:L-2,4-diaminobutyrate decarboxylase